MTRMRENFPTASNSRWGNSQRSPRPTSWWGGGLAGGGEGSLPLPMNVTIRSRLSGLAALSVPISRVHVCDNHPQRNAQQRRLIVLSSMSSVGHRGDSSV